MVADARRMLAFAEAGGSNPQGMVRFMLTDSTRRPSFAGAASAPANPGAAARTRPGSTFVANSAFTASASRVSVTFASNLVGPEVSATVPRPSVSEPW